MPLGLRGWPSVLRSATCSGFASVCFALCLNRGSDGSCRLQLKQWRYKDSGRHIAGGGRAQCLQPAAGFKDEPFDAASRVDPFHAAVKLRLGRRNDDISLHRVESWEQNFSVAVQPASQNV